MNIEEYIQSGILEMYVLGHTSETQNKEIAALAINYPEISNEIDLITETVIHHAESKSAELNITIKPLIIATLDYTQRLTNGEAPAFPAILNEKSQLADYAEFLNRSDMVLTTTLKDFFVKLIGYEPKAMTAIVWIKDATPYETHSNEHEKFLVVEGTCDIIMDSKTVSLVSGDYFSIPLHEGHVVKVTSLIPCKVILQRVAA